MTTTAAPAVSRSPRGGRLALVRYVVPWLRSSRTRLAWAATAVTLDAALTLCRPWPLKVVIDRVLSHNHRPLRVPFFANLIDGLDLSSHQLLMACCLCSLFIASGTGIFTYSFTRTMGDVARHFAFQLRRDLFSHLQRLSLRFHDKQRTGDLTTRLTSDVANVQEVVATAGVVLLSNLLLLLGMVLTMLWLNWRFALVALFPAPFLFATVMRYTQHIKVAARAARKSDGLLASVAQETFASIRIVQGLGREDLQEKRFEKQNQSSLQSYLEGVRYQARVAPLVDVLAGAGAALVMWYGASGVARGGLSTGDVVVFFSYVTNLYSPMRAIARLAHAVSRAAAGVERVGEALEAERELEDWPGAQAAPRLRGQIEFRGVSFEYEADCPVLQGIDLTIAAGEKVAIVGATGAGKSTLVSLVPRLYDPTAGSVRIDGADLRGYRLHSLREQVAIVLQESLLFSGSIFDNIAFGSSRGEDPAQVRAAAIVAGADDFIQRLPAGYDTPVGERGVMLSGGQRQRIAIARAIIRDAPILIMDEPTSGLDVATERRLLDALARAAQGRTTLLIAHRLSTVRLADRIVVLERGRIAEQGTHAELMRRRGIYAELYATSQGPVEAAS